MGGFLGGVGALGQGFMQGLGNAQQLRESAVRLKMQQLQLDKEKRDLMGEAALFAHVSGLAGQGQPPGQPPQGGAPGTDQSGMQGQPPTSPNAPGPGPVSSQPIPLPWSVGDQGQGGGQPQMPNPYAAPQGPQPPMPGQASVPMQQPGQQQQQAAPQQPMGGGQSPQQQPDQQFDVFTQYQSVLKIANDIQTRYAQANGGKQLDPATLLSATERALKLMQGLAPAQRLQLIDTANNLRAQVQTRGQDISAENTQARVGATERGQDIGAANTAARVGAQERGQDIGAASREKVADTAAASRERVEASRAATTQRGQDITSADRAASRDAAMQRAQFVQQQLNQRFAQGAGDKTRLQAQLVRSREIVAQMNAAQRIMNGIELATPGVKPETNAQYAAAQRSYEDAQQKLEILEKQSETASQTGAAGAGTPKVGDIITGKDGKRYKVTGGDPNDPDVEEVQ